MSSENAFVYRRDLLFREAVKDLMDYPELLKALILNMQEVSGEYLHENVNNDGWVWPAELSATMVKYHILLAPNIETSIKRGRGFQKWLYEYVVSSNSSYFCGVIVGFFNVIQYAQVFDFYDEFLDEMHNLAMDLLIKIINNEDSVFQSINKMYFDYIVPEGVNALFHRTVFAHSIETISNSTEAKSLRSLENAIKDYIGGVRTKSICGYKGDIKKDSDKKMMLMLISFYEGKFVGYNKLVQSIRFLNVKAFGFEILDRMSFYLLKKMSGEDRVVLVLNNIDLVIPR